MMKRRLALLLALSLAVCSCGGAPSQPSSEATSSQAPAASAEASSGEAGPADAEKLLADFFAEPVTLDSGKGSGWLPQLEAPASGTPLVTIETSMGKVTLALYPEAAPKAVENFLGHCKEGYYDNVAFHRVIKDFMIQGGDPNGNGTGGESIWGGKFDDELSDNLHHFRGAISMANSGANTNGSQFFIVHAGDTISENDVEGLMLTWYYNEVNYRLKLAKASGSLTDAELSALVDALNAQLEEMKSAGVPAEYKARYQAAAEAFLQNGGYPMLDYGYTVFGQVVEGMDTVDAIAAVEVKASASGEASAPVEPVYILSTTVGAAP